MVTTLIFLLDTIGRITEERLSGAVILLILISDLVSIMMAIITFTTRYEKRLIPTIAVIFTVLNTGVIFYGSVQSLFRKEFHFGSFYATNEQVT